MEAKEDSSMKKQEQTNQETELTGYDWLITNCQDRWRMAWWLTLAIAELGYLIFMAACAVIVSISQTVFVVYTVAWLLVSWLALSEIKWIGKLQVKRLRLKHSKSKQVKAGETK